MSHGAYVEIEALWPQKPHQRAAFWLFKNVYRWAERQGGDEPLLLHIDPMPNDWQHETLTHVSLILPSAGAFEALLPQVGEHWFVLPGATPDDPSRARVRLALHVDAGEHHGLVDHVLTWTVRGRPPPGICLTEVRVLHTPTGAMARCNLERSQLANRLLALRSLASQRGAGAASKPVPARSWDLVTTPDAEL